MKKKFICLRMVKMNGVDLEQFRFDYDLSWAALFLHPDGTVYARYGSRSVEGPMVSNSTEGLVATMERVLDAHRQYPGNRHLFAGKRGPEPRFRRPEDIPAPPLRGGGRGTDRGCIHCHNVHEALDAAEPASDVRAVTRRAFKYPFPENAGLVIEPVLGNRVTAVLPGSPAREAGMEAGDDVVALDGQAIFSIADVQFVLHNFPDEGDLEVKLRRHGESLQKVFRLRGDWRQNDFSWRVSLKGFPPAPGLYVYGLDASGKRLLGIDEKHVALEVRGLFEAPLRGSGLAEGDVIVGYDGRTESISGPRFDDYIRLNHFRPGSVLKLDVLRNGSRRPVEVKLSSP